VIGDGSVTRRVLQNTDVIKRVLIRINPRVFLIEGVHPIALSSSGLGARGVHPQMPVRGEG
jgi:hypothetical protein